jgi:hypothetical protein
MPSRSEDWPETASGKASDGTWVANNGSLYRDCVEPILGLRFKPGGQAATKDDAMMGAGDQGRKRNGLVLPARTRGDDSS